MDSIRYTLSLPAPHTHSVRADIPTAGRNEVVLMMAMWTPGSYLIREYERHVENVAAADESGAALAVSKTAKNRWAISPRSCESTIDFGERSRTDQWVCINLMTETGGGLEHADSAVLMTSRWATRTRKTYLGWLELASHELFHVWNGKRLRPNALGPFDYERETHTHSLWVVEGITDYYGDRRHRLLHLDLTLGAEPLKAWQLEVDPSATAAQRAKLDFWLARSGISGGMG